MEKKRFSIRIESKWYEWFKRLAKSLDMSMEGRLRHLIKKDIKKQEWYKKLENKDL